MDHQIIIIRILYYVYAVVCLIGLIGNMLALIVFSRKKFQNSIFSTYFRILTIFDLLTLLIRVDYFFGKFFNISLRNFTDWSCKLMYFLIYCIPAISSWMLCLISLDRYISIVKHNKFLFRKKTRNQLLACLIIIIYNVCLFLIPQSSVHMKNINEEMNQTSYKCNNDSFTIYLFDLISSIIIPFTIMLIFTLLTINGIFKSRKNINNNSVKVKDIKFAITTIALNLSFFILKFPQSFYIIFTFFIRLNETVDNLIFIPLSILVYGHYGTLFYLTFITNSSFRIEFIDIINKIKIKLISY